MIKVGITGQSGFIGSHLFNTLSLYPESYTRIAFEDAYFNKPEKLHSFVHQCDVVVHLAAVNRHAEPEVIYETNLSLVKQLIEACEVTDSKPHILFSSSTQEEKDNPYGKSKKEGRELLETWAIKNNARFSGLVIPNVFGPFGLPFYNSVVATFCHQLTHGEKPEIHVNGQLKLIFVGDLIAEFLKLISNSYQPSAFSHQLKADSRQPTADSRQPITNSRQMKADSRQLSAKITIPPTTERKVTDILRILKSYKSTYFENGIIPALKDHFEINLFNTFRSYINLKEFNPVLLKSNNEDRGTFVETIKTCLGGQFSFSTTKHGITRGNHFHTRKIERFAVIKGKARIQLRRIGTEEVLDFYLSGDEPSYVDMPVWYTHNITNISNDELYTLFWINEFYDPNDSDTFFEKV